jgi:hypothetical protein
MPSGPRIEEGVLTTSVGTQAVDERLNLIFSQTMQVEVDAHVHQLRADLVVLGLEAPRFLWSREGEPRQDMFLFGVQVMFELTLERHPRPSDVGWIGAVHRVDQRPKQALQPLVVADEKHLN